MRNISNPRHSGLVGPSDSEKSPWVLSPSDFAFLWDDCPRCFYLKVARRQPRPRSPFPSVFGKIDRAMKDCYLGERAEAAVDGMPPGSIGGGDRWVKSAPLLPPGSASTCLIRGRVDVLIDCDDGTKGVVDFKTTVPKADHLATYGRQLHAYAMALEHPSSGRPERVSSLGLLCFLPDTYEAEEGRAGLFGPVEWVELPRDDLGFAEFPGGGGHGARTGRPSRVRSRLPVVRPEGRDPCGGLSRVGGRGCRRCPARRFSTQQIQCDVYPGPDTVEKNSNAVHPSAIGLHYNWWCCQVTRRSEARQPGIIGEHRTQAPCPRRDSDRRRKAQRSFELEYAWTRRKTGEVGEPVGRAWATTPVSSLPAHHRTRASFSRRAFSVIGKLSAGMVVSRFGLMPR